MPRAYRRLNTAMVEPYTKKVSIMWRNVNKQIFSVLLKII